MKPGQTGLVLAAVISLAIMSAWILLRGSSIGGSSSLASASSPTADLQVHSEHVEIGSSQAPQGRSTRATIAKITDTSTSSSPTKASFMTKRAPSTSTKRSAHIDYGKNCSVNPALVMEEEHKIMMECPSEINGVETNPYAAWPKAAYLISLPSKMRDYTERRDFLNTCGIKLNRWPAVNGSLAFSPKDYSTMNDSSGRTIHTWYDSQWNVMRHEGWNDGYLSLGERGYLATMQQIFENALTTEMTSIMIFDEDVLFDCHFKEALLDTLRSRRCGGHVAGYTKKGGILILGASIWVEKWNAYYLKGWALTNHDLSAARSQFSAEPRCFNVHSKVFGSFAVIYHRHTFKPIIDWIKGHRKPFDHLYSDLAHAGHVIRVAYPFNAIQNVAHVSTIDTRGQFQANMTERARIHHWQLDRYCYPDFTPVLSVF